MRITIVQGAFFPIPPVEGGGVEKVWDALGQAFARAGHQVIHLSKAYSGFPDVEVRNGVEHRRVRGFSFPASLLWLKWLDLIYSLRIVFRLPPADILVTHTFWLPILVRFRKRGALAIHVARFPKGQLCLYRHAARWHAVSQAVAKAIFVQEPDHTSKIRVISNPVDAVHFLPSPEAQVREKNILYVGRIHPEKGLDLLLAAYERLLQEGKEEWTLRIVGPIEIRLGGGGEDYRKRLLLAFPHACSKAEWIGPVFDQIALSAFYRRASIFVYPSLAERGESFGLAPLEAMAHGCATIVSRLDCFSDFIEENVTGRFFDHRASNPELRLASVLQELTESSLQSVFELERLGKGGRRRAEDFQIDRIAEQYMRDFMAILNESKK